MKTSSYEFRTVERFLRPRPRLKCETVCVRPGRIARRKRQAQSAAIRADIVRMSATAAAHIRGLAIKEFINDRTSDHKPYSER